MFRFVDRKISSHILRVRQTGAKYEIRSCVQVFFCTNELFKFVFIIPI